ncbi:MAG: metalloprotease TldD [Pseudomonadota bacterium]
MSMLDIASKTLLSPTGLGIPDLQKLLARIHEHSVDYADVYAEYVRQESWALEEGIVKSGSFHIEQGLGLRAIQGEKSALAYVETLNWDDLSKAADTVRSMTHRGQTGCAPILQSKSVPAYYAGTDPLPSLSEAEKVALLEKLESYARQRDPRVTQVMASLSGSYQIMLVAGSDGRLGTDIRPLVRVSIQVIAESNGRREQGSSGGGGRFDYAYFSSERLQQYAKEAVDQALLNLEARPAPAGIMSVVLGAGWPGVLLHEAVGHGLEGDFNRKGSSAFAGRIGEQVASKGVTVVDDGTLPDRRGSLSIDDEGNASQRNILIEDGVLKSYLQDELNSRLMKTKPTGNGRRESFAHLPMPRMTNTLMLGGDLSPEEIIASVDKGLYAVNFGGGQVDITSGKFVFSASEAWWVEGGKLQYPVKGATLIGNGPDALTRITHIGNNSTLDSGVGVCGKEGQSVPVGVGQPTLRIEGLTVGGTAG